MEKFKIIDGFRHVIGNMGTVKRRPDVTFPNRVLKQRIGSHGYAFVELRIGWHYKKYYEVHKLVADAFLGPLPKGLVRNHKDFNKLNNCASNLEFLTNKENLAHAKAHGAKLGRKKKQFKLTV